MVDDGFSGTWFYFQNLSLSNNALFFIVNFFLIHYNHIYAKIHY